MKQMLLLSACLLACCASYGQKNANGEKKANPNKSGVAGKIQDMRRLPVEGIRAFVYLKDSIVSSGYTDALGYFETGYTLPGTYDVKLVYPSDKVMMVQGVPVKKKMLTQLSFKMTPPVADTVLSYGELKTPNP